VQKSAFAGALTVRTVGPEKGKGVFALRSFRAGDELGHVTPFLSYTNADTKVVYTRVRTHTRIVRLHSCVALNSSHSTHRGRWWCAATAGDHCGVAAMRKGPISLSASASERCTTHHFSFRYAGNGWND
jgi:hypothetical protein